MAIQSAVQTKTVSLRSDYSSKSVILTRNVVDNGDGTVTTTFGAIICPTLITYNVDSNNNPTGIFKQQETVSAINVDPTQLMGLFGMKVTLADGTVSYLGEILSNFTDQMIAAAIPDSGIIDTQNINIAAILAAQTAAVTPPTIA